MCHLTFDLSFFLPSKNSSQPFITDVLDQIILCPVQCGVIIIILALCTY